MKRATYRNQTLFAASQAGHIENFVDTLVWIAFPLFLVSQELNVAQVGVVVGFIVLRTSFKYTRDASATRWVGNHRSLSDSSLLAREYSG